MTSISRLLLGEVIFQITISPFFVFLFQSVVLPNRIKGINRSKRTPTVIQETVVFFISKCKHKEVGEKKRGEELQAKKKKEKKMGVIIK